MGKHYYIYSDDERHPAVYTKGLRVIKPRYVSVNFYLEFHYKDGKEISWYFGNSKDLEETYKKVKKCLPQGKNIDNDLTL